MKHNGWRKPTPGLVQAEKLAQVGERLNIPKSKAIVALKKVAASLGLKASDMLLLDTLSAITQDQDWEAGRRPIVWASNAFLEEQTGLSLRAVQRHICRLCEAGIISMKDSPNGKRWGRRNDEGYIIEAYGFDLAPLAARTEEFKILNAQNLEERALCKSLRHKITISRRIIRAKIEKALENSLKGPWREFEKEFELLLAKLPKRSETSEKLLDITDWFKTLCEKVENAFTEAFDWPEHSDEKESLENHEYIFFNQKMTCRHVNNDTHIQTTKKLNLVNSNSIRKKENEKFNFNLQVNRINPKNNNHIQLETIMAACPKFAIMAKQLGGYVENWEDLHRMASIIRPIIGISEDAWYLAQKQLGPNTAAAVISLIYDKYEKQEIVSVGGYLRGIVNKAINGNLHLQKSFYGRLACHNKKS